MTVANEMFGRQWKHHNEDSTSIDVDTAPSPKSIRETGRAVVRAIPGIVWTDMSAGMANLLAATSFHYTLAR